MYRSAVARFCQGLKHRSFASQALLYSEHGNPLDVLQLREIEVPPPGPRDAVVQFLAAPINPADVNIIQGKYPRTPSLPACAGMEGVGVVKALGAEVRASDLAPGDRVVPLDPMLGTWRSLAALPAASLYRIPECLPELPAACLTINPPTALCLLERFVDLEEGSVIVQNGANSAIGKAVVEVAASRGIKTLNIVRDRPNWDDVAERLTAIGATAVIRPEEAKAAGAGWKPALGLDCVGGESATAIAKLLRPGGTMVTYGAMSLKPISISAPLLIFKDLRIRGFALSKESTPDLKAKLLDRVITLAQKGLFASSRFEEFALEDYQEALQFCERGFRDSKAILRISH